MNLRLPEPRWIFLSTIVLVVVGTGLRFGIPVYREQVAIREIEKLGGRVWTEPAGPAWLRERVGDERMGNRVKIHDNTGRYGTAQHIDRKTVAMRPASAT